MNRKKFQEKLKFLEALYWVHLELVREKEKEEDKRQGRAFKKPAIRNHPVIVRL